PVGRAARAAAGGAGRGREAAAACRRVAVARLAGAGGRCRPRGRLHARDPRAPRRAAEVADHLDPPVGRPRHEPHPAGRRRLAVAGAHAHPGGLSGGRSAGGRGLRLGFFNPESGGPMMNALLVLALLTQDADLTVTGKAKREDKEYELTVSGRGKALQDRDQVRLRFTRFVNRLTWADGSLAVEALDDDSERVAPVEKLAFTHVERFQTAGDVEARIGWGPEGFPVRRIFRAASP